MEKNFEETKMFELFTTNFDSKVSLYSTDVELGPDFPYDIFRYVIKSVLRGSVAFIKEHESAADTVAIHCVDEKNNFIVAIVVSKEADDEGKNSYELFFITTEEEYDSQKDSFDKIIEANEPAIIKFLANFLIQFTSSATNGRQGIKVADNAAIMYVAMLAFFMSIEAYANNVTEDEVKDDGLVVKFDDELIISIEEENNKRVVNIEPGTALKTFVKSDEKDQQA